LSQLRCELGVTRLSIVQAPYRRPTIGTTIDDVMPSKLSANRRLVIWPAALRHGLVAAFSIAKPIATPESAGPKILSVERDQLRALQAPLKDRYRN
jgi:hypothetical protein